MVFLTPPPPFPSHQYAFRVKPYLDGLDDVNLIDEEGGDANGLGEQQQQQQHHVLKYMRCEGAYKQSSSLNLLLNT